MASRIENPWHAVLDDALVCRFLLDEKNVNDPKQALNDIINWEIMVSQDPAVNGPEGPSDRIISIAMAAQECAFAWEPTAQLIGDVCAEDIADLCGAVLARCGRPAVKPVPVSERMPGEGDCDSEGRCWLTSVDVEPGWVTDNPEQCTNWTHWLPYHSLPVPATTTQETP